MVNCENETSLPNGGGDAKGGLNEVERRGYHARREGERNTISGGSRWMLMDKEERRKSERNSGAATVSLLLSDTLALGGHENLNLERHLRHGRASGGILIPHGGDEVDDFTSPCSAHRGGRRANLLVPDLVVDGLLRGRQRRMTSGERNEKRTCSLRPSKGYLLTG